jgi:hypothetical protein
VARYARTTILEAVPQSGRDRGGRLQGTQILPLRSVLGPAPRSIGFLSQRDPWQIMATPNDAQVTTTVLLSTGGGLGRSVGAVRAAAGAAGYAAVELDLSGRWRRIGRMLGEAEGGGSEEPPIATVVLPARTVLSAAAASDSGTVLGRVLALGPSAVLLDPSVWEKGTAGRAGITGGAEAVRLASGGRTRFGVVIRPGTLRGGRAHLTELSGLRRMAEEWDFDLVLDLVGGVDPQWEAEAAVVRIGSRLRMVRLGRPTLEVRADSINGRVVARALTASLHLRNRLVISVVPPLAPWEGLGQRWPVSRCTAWRQRIETRIETVDAAFRDSLRWSPPKRSFLERESG